MKANKSLMLALMATFAITASAQVVTTPSEQESTESVVSSVVTARTDPQNTKKLSNEELSTQYKLQMDVVNSEIKTLKVQSKLYKGDANKFAEIKGAISSKKSELSELKAKKKIADKAVKAEKASEKALKASEKAEKASQKASEKAAKASEKAEKANQKAAKAVEKAAALQK